MPTPYALSSDLVSAWPAKSLEVATYLDTALAAKTDTAMTQLTPGSSPYAMVLADAGRLVTPNSASANQVTVTKQATVTWVTGTQLRVLNLGAGVTTIVGDTGVTITNNKAISQYQGGTLIRTASDAWLFVPNAGAPLSATATVATSQSITSGTYTDLATTGPAVTLITGTKALVEVSAQITHTAATAGYMGFAVSGASTIAAADNASLAHYVVSNGVYMAATRSFLVTGLTAGSNTFTAKYRSISGSFAVSFLDRFINVIDLGS